jgi:hypothetical protein
MKAEYFQHQAIYVMPTSQVIKIKNVRLHKWFTNTVHISILSNSLTVPITRGQNFVKITKLENRLKYHYKIPVWQYRSVTLMFCAS